MDQRMQRAVLEKTLEVAVEKILEAEQQLDDAIDHFDNLTSDELSDLRRKRKLEYEANQKKRLDNIKLGHGKYSEVYDQLEWFEACKASERVITHFYRPTTNHCVTLDTHLEKLATLHPESRFIKINAEKAPYLADKLVVHILPTIVITKNNRVLDTIEGFTELGDTDQFTTETLELRLGKKSGIDFGQEELKQRQIRQQQANAQEKAIRQSDMHSARAKLVSTLEDDGDDWLNDD